jgi:mRNA interferase RelE/StbE
VKYGVKFHPDALQEFFSLDKGIREILVKKISKRVANPFIESARLSGELHNCYKIKDRKSGIRIIYKVQVEEKEILIIVVGKRENNSVYEIAPKRL